MNTNSARSRHVVTVATRGGTDLDKAMLGLLDAALDKALLGYRMAGFPRLFKDGRDGPRFYHLFLAGSHLSLCEGMAVARPDRLRPVVLADVGCVACLHEFTERTRP